MKELKLSDDQEKWLNGPARSELKKLAEERKSLIDVSMLDFGVEHIAEIRINYDYINELLAKLLNEVKEGAATVRATYDNFKRATDQLEDRRLADQMVATADEAMEVGELEGVTYPVVPESVSEIVRGHTARDRRQASLRFREKWGLVDVATAKLLIDRMLDRHILHKEDLADGGELSQLLADAVAERLYQQDAQDEEIRRLSPIKYRNSLRQALYEFADYVVSHY